MRMYRILHPLLALALLAPAALSAQEPRTGVFSFFNRGMLGILTEAVPAGSMNARQRVVVDVIEDSPAEKAGLLKGDTLLSINGLAASQQVMNLPFEPGDTLVLRVKRDGRERDMTVVAAERTSHFTYSRAFPDSVGERISVIMDRVRAGVDTIHLPRVTMHTFGDDSTHTIVINGDTIRTFRGMFRGQDGHNVFTLHADSMLLHADSLFQRLRPGDLQHILGDSTTFRIFSNAGDSGHLTWRSHLSPFDVWRTTATLGMRAVAGAELAPLNPGLAEYFGATEGVLVINAREGTPAARAGLRAGDVILQVDGTAVTSISDLRHGIDRSDADDVKLRVLRRGENIDVTLDRR